MVIFMSCEFHLSKNEKKKKRAGRREESLLRDFPGGAVDKNLSANAGDTVWILVQKDPTCLGATKSVHHNYLCLKPMLCKKKNHTTVIRSPYILQQRVPLLIASRESPSKPQRAAQPKANK